ncbi:MAG: restriction endonuclease [Bacteroidales bacterium]|jgi:site-specific DNA-methyltransferase (adenine-specific)|nr:restriction endonuclease [Bacteroidales bacterium]
MNQLHYGDNLNILRNNIADDSIDLCYIDPPFNSNRDYNQIYNNTGTEDKAQATAFIDTWIWDKAAERGFEELLSNSRCLATPQTINLIRGLQKVLGHDSLLAYIVSMALRVQEIHRVLKPTGSFYLHCDPTASHYLKLLLDSVFVPLGGSLRNEMIWCYSRMAAKGQRQLSRCHDIIFWYSKGKKWIFNVDDIRLPYAETSKARAGYKKTNLGGGTPKGEICELNENGKFPEDWIQIPFIRGKEYLGYPTQKPEALLERIIKASSNEGDLVLDAYCGCGTTVAVAQRLNRQWIGIDITYQSISLILKRLEEAYGKDLLNEIDISGSPRDIASAKALATKKDDRTRKEFEKWAILTYSNNRAVINEKKGADKGIDGIAYMMTDKYETQEILFSVKSGKVGVAQIRDLRGVVEREGAASGIFITLQSPTKEMLKEATTAGYFTNPLTDQQINRIQIVSIESILNGERLQLPMVMNILKKAEKIEVDNQIKMWNE